MTTRSLASFLLVFSVLPGIILVGAPLSNFFRPAILSTVLGTVVGGILLSHPPREILHGLQSYLSREPLDATENASVTDLLSNLASLSMAGGLLGLLFGLVGLFRSLDDPSAIGPSMANALLALFYGIVLCEFMFRPAAADCAQRVVSAGNPSRRELS